MIGLVSFRLGAREYATPLSAVREVVRLQGLADLPGMTPPLAGVLDVRGTALPVLDLRVGAQPGDPGDVLVIEQSAADGGPVGVAVDQVRAVVDPAELPAAGGTGQEGVLPAYVLDVLRGRDGVVFLVDLLRMVAGTAAQTGTANTTTLLR